MIDHLNEGGHVTYRNTNLKAEKSVTEIFGDRWSRSKMTASRVRRSEKLLSARFYEQRTYATGCPGNMLMLLDSQSRGERGREVVKIEC